MSVNTNYRFNYNQKIIGQLKKYNANTAYDSPNVNVSVLDQFSIDYPNVSVILKNFISELPEINLEYLGIDSGNLNIAFSSNISTNYFVANVDPDYFLCYSRNNDRITATINLKDYV